MRMRSTVSMPLRGRADDDGALGACEQVLVRVRASGSSTTSNAHLFRHHCRRGELVGVRHAARGASSLSETAAGSGHDAAVAVACQ